MFKVLDETDVIALTKRSRYNAQLKQLDHMQIRYKVRADGSPMVLASDVYDDLEPDQHDGVFINKAAI